MNHEEPITNIIQLDLKFQCKRQVCDHSDAYILVKGTITVANTAVQGQVNNGANKKVIFKNCAPFTSCVSRINDTKVDDAQYIDVVIPLYNLIEHSDNYSKTSGILWQYCRDVPALGNNGAITDFTEANDTTESFNLKEKLTGTKNVEIMISLKCLSNFWRTLEMPLISYEVTLDLKWSEKYVIAATDVADQAMTFSITDTKIYVPVVTLLTQGNSKLLEQLKFGFKRTINWNKYQPKISTERPNQCLGS